MSIHESDLCFQASPVLLCTADQLTTAYADWSSRNDVTTLAAVPTAREVRKSTDWLDFADAPLDLGFSEACPRPLPRHWAIDRLIGIPYGDQAAWPFYAGPSDSPLEPVGERYDYRPTPSLTRLLKHCANDPCPVVLWKTEDTSPQTLQQMYAFLPCDAWAHTTVTINLCEPHPLFRNYCTLERQSRVRIHELARTIAAMTATTGP